MPIALQIVKVLEKRQGVATEYVEFEGCGHVPMDERPEQFNAAVSPFVSSILSRKLGAQTDGPARADFEAPEQPLQAVDLTTPARDAIPVQPGV